MKGLVFLAFSWGLVLVQSSCSTKKGGESKPCWSDFSENGESKIIAACKRKLGDNKTQNFGVYLKEEKGEKQGSIQVRQYTGGNCAQDSEAIKDIGWPSALKVTEEKDGELKFYATSKTLDGTVHSVMPEGSNIKDGQEVFYLPVPLNCESLADKSSKWVSGTITMPGFYEGAVDCKCNGN